MKQELIDFLDFAELAADSIFDFIEKKEELVDNYLKWKKEQEKI